MNFFCKSLILGFTSLVLFLVGSGTGFGESRPALTLPGHWEVSQLSPDPVQGGVWHSVGSGIFEFGGTFAQMRAWPKSEISGCSSSRDTSGHCLRLTITVPKPFDQSAVLKVQAPSNLQNDVTRSFGVSAGPGSTQISVVLNEISLDDFGAVAFQLVVMGAQSSSYGQMNLRTYDQDLSPQGLLALDEEGSLLASGDSVHHGWRFLFFGNAPKINVMDDPQNFLSLCVFKPDSSFECSSSNRFSIHITKKGDYLFTGWDTQSRFSQAVLHGI